MNFGDIVVAQQTLATLITSYIDVLNQQWQAVVDVARLMQLEDVAEVEFFADKATDGLNPPGPDR